MANNNVSAIMKQYIFYVILGIGIIALIVLVAVSSMKNGNEANNVSLNEPGENTAVTENLAQEEEDSKPVINTDTKKDTTEEDTDSTAKNTTDDASENTPTSNEASDENGTNDAGTTSQNSEQTQETMVFSEDAGLMWPLAGNVILPFSMDRTVYYQTLDQYRCNPGMLIQGEEGVSVVACARGRVISIEDTKEYGTVVTLDIGSGYKAIYGQLKDVTVKEGNVISSGKAIGNINKATSYYTKEGSHLYFAITKDDSPVNPMLLIKE